MSLKWFLFLLLISKGFTVKSQTLLNADSSQIRKELNLRGVGLKKSYIERDLELKGYYRKMIFQFPIPPEGNSCLMKITFYLTLKNKCFKYDEAYWGKDIVDKRIREFNKPTSGLTQVKGSLKWINPGEGFEVNLFSKRIGKNKFVSMYILEFKQLH